MTQTETATNPARKPTSIPTQDVNMFPDGFLALRSGIFDHLYQSRFTPNEFLVYCILLKQCDWGSGRWNGNAHRIRAAIGHVLNIRQIQQAMRRLMEKGYTKSFYKQGIKGNYFVLIHKYRVCVGDLKTKVLNAAKSDSYTRPVYEDGRDKDVISAVGGCDLDLRLKSPVPDVDIYQEYKNTRSQESQDSGGGGGEEAPRTLLEDQPPAGNEQQELLADMREIWDHHRLTGWNTKPADIERAVTLSEQYGKRTFLLAFDSWCYNDASDQLAMKFGEQLMFPLPKFLGQIDYYVKRSREEYEVTRRNKPYSCPIVQGVV